MGAGVDSEGGLNVNSIAASVGAGVGDGVDPDVCKSVVTGDCAGEGSRVGDGVAADVGKGVPADDGARVASADDGTGVSTGVVT